MRKMDDLRYGWYNFRPRWLQKLNNPKCLLLAVCSFSFFQSMILNGVSTVILPTLEKQFRLNSKSTGFMSTVNDIAAVIFLLPLSYYGSHGNKAKILGWGAFVAGIGSIVFIVPKLLIGSYHPSIFAGEQSRDLCIPNSPLTSRNHSLSELSMALCDDTFDSSSLYLAIFCIGQFLIGAGAAPIYSVGTAYLDENCHPEWTPMYMACQFSSLVVGGSLGAIMAGVFLKMYVDIEMPPGLSLHADDPRWIGCWWLPHIIAFSALCIVGVFILGFPKQLPGTEAMRLRLMQTGKLPKRDDAIQGKLHDVIPATKKLLINQTLMMNIIGDSFKSIFVASVLVFNGKILQTKFGMSPYKVGFAISMQYIPGIIVGVLGSGYAMKWMKVKASGVRSALILMIFSILSVPAPLTYFIPGCKDTVFAGVTTSYVNSSLNDGLLAACNLDCACTEANAFNPVCGSDSVTYFSPCYAGCLQQTASRKYTNCSCVLPPDGSNTLGSSVSGICLQDCKNVFIFITIMAIMGTINFAKTVPTQMVVLRSVPDNQRPYAMGLKFVFLRSFGNICGPVLVGALIDMCCNLWSVNQCDVIGDCLDYNIVALSSILVMAGVIPTGLSAICHFLSWLFWPAKLQNVEVEGETEDTARKSSVIKKLNGLLRNKHSGDDNANTIRLDQKHSSIYESTI